MESLRSMKPKPRGRRRKGDIRKPCGKEHQQHFWFEGVCLNCGMNKGKAVKG